MKIDGISTKPINSIQEINRIKPVDKNRAQAGEDAVVVSEKGFFFQTLLNKAKGLPNIRNERVNALTEQIEDGSFKIDAAKIARSILFNND